MWWRCIKPMKKLSDGGPTRYKISRQQAASCSDNQQLVAAFNAELTTCSALSMAVITELHLKSRGYTMQRLKASSRATGVESELWAAQESSPLNIDLCARGLPFITSWGSTGLSSQLSYTERSLSAPCTSQFSWRGASGKPTMLHRTIAFSRPH